MNALRTTSRHRPNGAALLEATMSLAIVALVIAGVAQLLVLAAQQRRFAAQRELAVNEAANLMEQCMTLPWNQLEQVQVDETELSENSRKHLPDAALEISIQQADEGGAKQIAIQIDWRNPAGQRVRPIRLVAWRHRLEEDSRS